ncbi:MAG: sigma-54-dependent Fis family transcriptional regulator [Calditrichaeota bacterium]|nr:sigma-54-dependent Fis family transcriptional regulator [Calditrichota bacterium]
MNKEVAMYQLGTAFAEGKDVLWAITNGDWKRETRKMPEPTLLIVDEETTALERVSSSLRAEGGYRVLTETDPSNVLNRLETETVDVVLCDLDLKGASGVTLIGDIRSRHLRLPVVIYSENDRSERIVEAMENGATNFVTQPLEPRLLARTVDAALSNLRLAGEVEKLKRRLGGDHKLGGLVGRSAAMHKVFDAIREVAAVDTTVLIRAETGAGKELVARALHFEGPRSEKPFVKVNCAALPETLLESELFGHERGAFTDAKQLRIGKFEQANGGTIFLDEIGELSLSTQVKLLNVLQDREIERLGGNRKIPVNIRVVTATNRDLERMIQEGRFRMDLYYRLNVVPITIPPLRERREDIPMLCAHFLDKIGGRLQRGHFTFTDDAMALLLSHPWPGNVRELENVIERAILASTGTTITANTLQFLKQPIPTTENNSFTPQVRPPVNVTLPASMPMTSSPVSVETMMTLGPLKNAVRTFEKQFIENAMLAANGHVLKAARMLQIDRTTLWKKAKDLGIDLHPEEE